MSLRNGTGTIALLAFHAHPDWATNNHAYQFGPASGGGVDVVCVKRPDKTFEVMASDADGISVVMRGPTAPIKGGVGVVVKVDVVVKWKNGTVTLEIDGSLVDTCTVPAIP